MIYLDNAATSFPKPARVIEECARCMRTYCGNPGRSSHPLSVAAAEKIYECRAGIAELFGASDPASVCFTHNATEAINTVLKGLLHTGDHVLLSDMEHNAVLRPLAKLAREGRISYDVFPTYATLRDASALDICRGIEARLRPNTKLLVCTHIPNICSVILPIAEIGALCRRHGILFVLDAAQSAGHIPIDLSSLAVDVLCAPGHKGLLGPQGTGFFILQNGVMPDTLTEGGSGYRSLDPEMPRELPERFEAGTLPTPALAGLFEGICALRRMGTEQIAAYESRLIAHLYAMLCDVPSITLYASHHQGSILLLNIDGIPAQAVGRELARRGICVRCGYHCAALGHETLGTPEGGAVRISAGPFNRFWEMERVGHVIRQLALQAR